MIAQLKRDVQQLKAELAMATGQQYNDELTDEEIERFTTLCFNLA